MPIKGISDVRRLPRLGKIKTGEKREKLDQNGKPKLNKKGEPITYPVALDYFVVPPEVEAVYGKNPRELDIMFPLNDESVIFPQDMKKYGSTGLKCKGDGEVGYMSINGELVQRSCDPDDEWCKDCQPRAILNVLLPDVPGFGVWQITTGSWNSIVNINSQITAIKAMTGGRIDYIPLKLRIVPHNATVVTSDGKQFQKEVYVLRLDIAEKMSDFFAKFGRRGTPELPGQVQNAVAKLTGIRREQYSDEEIEKVWGGQGREAITIDPPDEEAFEEIEKPTIEVDSDNEPTCSECGVTISTKVFEFSNKRYKRALCMDCQKKAKSEQVNDNGSTLFSKDDYAVS